MSTIYENNPNRYSDFPIIAFYSKMLNYEFESFTEIKNVSPLINNFNFYISKTIDNDSDFILLIRLLCIFPYYFFADISQRERESIINLINKNKKFKNRKELIKLFEFHYDVRTLRHGIQKLKEENYTFNYTDIVTTTYRTLLEYAFLTLTNSIKIQFDKTVIELIEIYLKIEGKKKQTIPEKFFSKYFNETISNSNENLESYIKNKKFFTEDKFFSKILFSKIYFNLFKKKSELSATKRNQLLRPIYFELICKMFFKDLYQLGVNDKDVVKKLKDTITYLESKRK